MKHHFIASKKFRVMMKQVKQQTFPSLSRLYPANPTPKCLMSGHLGISFPISCLPYRSACEPECSLAGIKLPTCPTPHSRLPGPLLRCAKSPKSYELRYLKLTRTMPNRRDRLRIPAYVWLSNPLPCGEILSVVSLGSILK